MLSDIEYRNNLLNTVNRAANILLATDSGQDVESSILKSMELIGRVIEVDRVQIWKNEMTDGSLHFVHTYQWLSDFGEQNVPVPIGLSIPYSAIPHWEEMFLRRETINSPLSKLTQIEQDLLAPYNMKSIVIIPLFLHDAFWGFFSLDECTNERAFPEEEIGILLSAGMLISNALLRDEMVQNDRKTVAKLNAVISNYPGAIWSVDKDNTITLFDGLYLEKIGVTRDFLEGKKIDVARQKNRHLDIVEHIDKTFAEKSPQDWMSEIDGKIFRSRIIPIFEEDGSVSSVVGNIDDLTEILQLQKELETALEKAEAAVQASKSAQLTMSAMFGSNTQINILFDHNFKAIDCNFEAVKFLGFETKEAMIAGFIERIENSIPERQPDGHKSIPLSERFVTTVKEGSVKFRTELHLGQKKRNLDVALKKIPYENSFAIVGYIDDVTEIHEREMKLKHTQEQLKKAVEEAREASRAKSDFLANMSHEIRTPINAITGMTSIGMSAADIEKKDYSFKKINDASKYLLGIINDILDLSKIEAGKFELSPVEFEFEKMLRRVVDVNRFRIDEKQQDFAVHIKSSIPKYLYADEQRLAQVITNLLSNAVKFTPENGSVKIAADYLGEQNGICKIQIAVTDSGIGIDKEQQGKLFKVFQQAESSTSRKYGGTGLGLAISKSIVDMMGGEIWVESEPGRGSTFSFRVKMKVGKS